MRSKSEVIISDIYKSKGITVRYEEPLYLPSGVTLHPDFTIITDSGSYRYHEHFGMLEHKRYTESSVWKIGAYLSNGLYPNRDVLFTTDDRNGGLDIRKISQLIDWFAGQ